MMGSRQVAQGALFYEFSLEDHVPQDHLIRAIDRFVDLSGIRQHLAPFYSNTGRPSVDPELMIRIPCVTLVIRIAAEAWLKLPPDTLSTHLDSSFQSLAADVIYHVKYRVMHISDWLRLLVTST